MWTVLAKQRNGVTVIDKGRFKERWAEHFENMLNRDSYRKIYS